MSVSDTEAAAATRLMEMTIDHWRGELMLHAAELNLAEKFEGDGPRSAKELAAEYDMVPRPFYRFLRALTGTGLLSFAGKDSFRLIDLGKALKIGAPGAARSAFPGGEERTSSEYCGLLAANGFEMTQVVPTSSPVCVVEAVRA